MVILVVLFEYHVIDTTVMLSAVRITFPLRGAASTPFIKRGFVSCRNGSGSKVFKRLAYTEPKTVVQAIPVESAESVVRPVGWSSKRLISKGDLHV